MMLQKFLKSSLLALLLVPALLNLPEGSAIAETSIDEDKLDTVHGMRWAGRGLPFTEMINIKDALVNSALGKVVIDRHGEDVSRGFLHDPFGAPRPGRFVIISLWGSKVEGCFVKMVVQSAPTNGEANLKDLVPQLIELGIGEQIVQLTPNPNTKIRGFTGKYTYTEYENKRETQITNTWYMTDTLFAVNSNAANLLRNAPSKEVRARLTFADGDTKVFPIGENTVKQWRETYGFNASCLAPN